jgi:PAS domain S-box-containing protein
VNDDQRQQHHQHEKLQRLIYENLKDYAMFTLDLDGRHTSWNPGVQEVLGYAEREFLALPAAVIFTDEDRARGAPEREQLLARSTGRAEDKRWHVRKDGSVFWANGVLTALRDEQDTLYGFLKIMQDQTPQKLFEEELEQRVEERTRELRQAQQHFEQVFRIGPFAAVITTMGVEHTFRNVNDSFEHLSGYSREEAVGKTNKQLGMWSSPEEARTVDELLTQQGYAREVELTLTTKEGHERTIITSAVVLADGEPLVVRMFYDITERKRNEEQLAQAIQEVMTDASWFSRAVVERLVNIRSGKPDMTQLAELTPRERQVLERIASGMNNDDIGRELGISSQTVRNYISIIYDKTGVRSRAEAVVWARERGLVGF